ncbi:MAG TPA: tyrosine-type recombinase/integrase [Clostridiales bacterium]|nr:tyrosine-type recombinase/integrase [Clostridiales bacterium]
MENLNYHDKTNIKNSIRLKELQTTLPRFSKDYFRGIEPNTSSRTRLAYAYDLRTFFEFLNQTNPELKNTDIADYKIEILDLIEPVDIEEYLDYLTYYESDNLTRINKERGKSRKLSALKSFYNYYYQKQLIKTNPASFISAPKLYEKDIVRLDVDEVAKLLDAVESGDNMTARQKTYHNKTKKRDLAIMTLLLGTGIRVSECVGLDLNHINFENNGMKIIRKGGNEVVIYFGDEVQEALYDYIQEREKMIPASGHENAFFLSLQMKRLSTRSIENLVKKYSSSTIKLKKITPHKLRSTYGTSLYRETGDIYLVADVLGHKDVNTTKKHYAAIEEDRRISAAKMVKLRKE